MISDRYMEERIRSWLSAVAPERTPDFVLQDTFDQTRHMAQASRSRSRRALTLMPRRAAVATAAAVVLVAAGLGFGRIVPTEEPAGPGGPLTSMIGAALAPRREHRGHDRTGPGRHPALLLAGRGLGSDRR